MKRFVALTLVFVSSIGFAQDGPPPKDLLLGRKVFLVLTPPVKEAVKLTQDQERKIKDAFGETLQVEGDKVMLALGPDTDLGQMEKDAMKVLSVEQSRRLGELFLQRVGGLGLLDDEVSKALKLTDMQKQQVNKLGDEAAAKIMEIFQGGANGEAAQLSRDVRKSYGSKMEQLLTETQRKSFEAMKGELIKWKDGLSPR